MSYEWNSQELRYEMAMYEKAGVEPPRWLKKEIEELNERNAQAQMRRWRNLKYSQYGFGVNGF